MGKTKNKRIPVVLRVSSDQLILLDWLAVELSMTREAAAKIAALRFTELYYQDKERKSKNVKETKAELEGNNKNGENTNNSTQQPKEKVSTAGDGTKAESSDVG